LENKVDFVLSQTIAGIQDTLKRKNKKKHKKKKNEDESPSEGEMSEEEIKEIEK
jgi:hypothetical protein